MNDNSIVINPTGASTEVNVDVGQKFTVRLPSHEGGGFIWSVHESTGFLLWPLERDEPETIAVGGFGHLLFSFSAKEPGRFTIVLHEKRPWEEGRPCAACQVNVNVREKNA